MNDNIDCLYACMECRTPCITSNTEFFSCEEAKWKELPNRSFRATSGITDMVKMLIGGIDEPCDEQGDDFMEQTRMYESQNRIR